MQLEVSILSTDDYGSEEIVREDIPDKYPFDDQGELLLASTFFDKEENVWQLIAFLFQNLSHVTAVYRDETTYILDLTIHRNRLVSFEYLEEFYPEWIKSTSRRNTMDEYGMLLDFIGMAKKGSGKKHLLMLVSNR